MSGTWDFPMGEQEGYWIQDSIKKGRRGRLRRFAKRHDALNEDGTINLTKAREAAKRLENPEDRETRLKEINEAHTLRELNRM